MLCTSGEYAQWCTDHELSNPAVGIFIGGDFQSILTCHNDDQSLEMSPFESKNSTLSKKDYCAVDVFSCSVVNSIHHIRGHR